MLTEEKEIFRLFFVRISFDNRRFFERTLIRKNVINKLISNEVI